eukprot:GEMP01000769.1.p1 GENE.GEMP01000769.1~~GEMP01000769.1.p1  ORF type:complete len:1841 (-),score=424.56 GEMP01000769.1:548-6070(-)
MLVADASGAWAALYHDKHLHFYSLYNAEEICSYPVEVGTIAFHPVAPILAAATNKVVQIYTIRKGVFTQVQTIKVPNVVAMSFSFDQIWMVGSKIEAFRVTLVNNELVHMDEDADKSLANPAKVPVTYIAACTRAVAVVANPCELHVWYEDSFAPPLQHFAPIVEALWRPAQDELIIAVLAKDGIYLWRETPLHEEFQLRLEAYITVDLGHSLVWFEKCATPDELTSTVHHRPASLISCLGSKGVSTAHVAFVDKGDVKLMQLSIAAGKVLTFSVKDVLIPRTRTLLGLTRRRDALLFTVETIFGDIELWDAGLQKHWALSTQRGEPVSVMSALSHGMVVGICGPLIRWFDPPHKGKHIARDAVEGSADSSWLDVAMIPHSTALEPKALALNDRGQLYVVRPRRPRASAPVRVCRRVENAPPARSVSFEGAHILLYADNTLHVGSIANLLVDDGEERTWVNHNDIPFAQDTKVALHGDSMAKWIPDEGLFLNEYAVQDTAARVVALAHCGDACAVLFHTGFLYLWAVREDHAPIFRCKERLPRAAKRGLSEGKEGSFRPWNVLGPVSTTLFGGTNDDSLDLISGTIQFHRVTGDGLICACSGMNENGLCGPVVMVRTRGFGESWKLVKGWDAEGVSGWCFGEEAFHLAKGQEVEFHQWSAELVSELKKSQPMPLYHPDTLYFLALQNKYEEVRRILRQLQQFIEGRAEVPVTSRFSRFSPTSRGTSTSRRDDEAVTFDLAVLQERCHERIPLLEPSDQTKLLSWLPLFAKNPSEDDFGAARFKTAWAFLTELENVPHLSDAMGTTLCSEDLIWAMHSVDLGGCVKAVMVRPTWEEYRKAGLGLWCGDQEMGVLRQAIEEIPRRILQGSKDKEKNPEDVALWYALLGRKTLLVALYKQAKKLPIAKLLVEELHQEPNRTKVLKNAYHLITQKRYFLAATFFFLAGEYRDACDVCVRYIQDLSLAMVVARFGDSQVGTAELVTHIAIDEILPLANDAKDPFLLSMVHWHAKDYAAAWEALQAPCLFVPSMRLYGPIRYSPGDSPSLPAVRQMVYQKLKWKRIEVPPPISTEPTAECYLVRRLGVLIEATNARSTKQTRAASKDLETQVTRMSRNLQRAVMATSVMLDRGSRPKYCTPLLRNVTSLFETDWKSLQLDFELPFLTTWKDHPNAELARSLRRYNAACLQPLHLLEWKKGPVSFSAPCLYIAMQITQEPRIRFALALLLNVYSLTPGLQLWEWDAAAQADDEGFGGSAWASACLASLEEDVESEVHTWTKKMQWDHLLILLVKGHAAPLWEFPDPEFAKASRATLGETSTVSSHSRRSEATQKEQQAFEALQNRLHHDSSLEFYMSQLFASLIVHLCCEAVRQVVGDIDTVLPMVTLVDQRARDLMTGTKQSSLLVQALRGGDAELLLPKLSFATEAAISVWRRLNCSHMLEIFITHNPKIQLSLPSTDTTDEGYSRVLMKLKSPLSCMAGDPGQLSVKLWFDQPTPTEILVIPMIRGQQWDLAAEAFLGQVVNFKVSNEHQHFQATTKVPTKAVTRLLKSETADVLGVPKFAKVHPSLPIYALVGRKDSTVQVFGFQPGTALCTLYFNSPSDMTSPRGSAHQIKGIQWNHTHRLLGMSAKRFCLWSFRYHTPSSIFPANDAVDTKKEGMPYFTLLTTPHRVLHTALFVSPSLIATCGVRSDDAHVQTRSGVAVWDTLTPSNPLVAHDRTHDDQTVYTCMTLGPSSMHLTLGTQDGSIAIFDILESSWTRRLPNAHESIAFLFPMGNQMEYVATLSSSATLKVWSYADWDLVSERHNLHAEASLLGGEDRLILAQRYSSHHILTAGRDALILHRVV